MKRLFFLSFLLMTFLWSCDHIENTGFVYGTVTAASGDSTMTSVVVQCGGKTSTTTSNGNYTLKDIPIGNTQLSASKTGYQTYTNMVNIQSGGTRQDIQMVSSTSRKQ